MSLADSLMVSLLGMGVVFLVLISLSFLIQVLSVILGSVTKSGETAGQEGPEVSDGDWVAGELKLIGVDEPTAAMIMAIVSDESQIPLSELNFKMIRAIDQIQR